MTQPSNQYQYPQNIKQPPKRKLVQPPKNRLEAVVAAFRGVQAFLQFGIGCLLLLSALMISFVLLYFVIRGGWRLIELINEVFG